jgi:predicted small lipoprotein YifL
MGARIAGAVVMLSTLAACAGNQGPTPPLPLPQADMAGRWTLAAPNAPACGMEFTVGPGRQEGIVVPEGGCPGQFYTSHRWSFAEDTQTLTISDEENAPLAQLKPAGTQFIGRSTTGMPVTLAR